MHVFVVGATGLLGGQVVDRLLAKGDRVTALVRSPEAGRALAQKGVATVQGDLKNLESLRRALWPGFDGLITTAYGYSRRQKGDTLQSVDDLGNRNLIAAAREVGIGRFVFTSILTAERAVAVPHFYQKARTEAQLAKSGLKWVALRPGGFLDTLLGLNAKGISGGKLMVPSDPDAPASTILSADVSSYLVEAVRLPDLAGERIDIGTAKPTSITELAAILTSELGHPVRAVRPPRPAEWLLRLIARLRSGSMADNLKAMAYVSSGQYVADTTRQAELFGPPPTVEDSVRRWIRSVGGVA
jgi:uncharacterized protein YbjT (DUF2867 family)